MLASCQKELPHQKKVSIDKPAELSLSIDGVDEVIGLMAPKIKTYNIHVTAGSVADELVTVTIAPNPDKVAEFNAANNTNYEMVPGDAYEISNKTFIIPRYNTEGSSSYVTLKANGLPDDEKVRVLPITISKVESDDDVTVTDSTVFIQVYRISTANIRFEKGTGTAADPFLVETGNDMYAMANDLKAGEATYIKLAADIDMSSIEEWSPIMTADAKEVHFDGNGKTISNLNCVSANMPSLFGILKGSIKNVTFENCTVNATTGTTGTGLIAAQAVDAEITGVTVKGLEINVKGSTATFVGGLVGKADGVKFENNNIEVNVNDEDGDNKMPDFVAGMVAIAEGKASSFKNCHVEGSVIGNRYAAGMVGFIYFADAVVTNCSTDVKLSSLHQYGGGMIAYSYEGLTITNCHTTGEINTINAYNGGLLGACRGKLTVKKCYTTGTINNTVGTHVGGLIGNIGVYAAKSIYGNKDGNTEFFGNSLIEDCYSARNINITNGSGNSGRMCAGFIAIMEKTTGSTVRRCYSSGDISAVGANGPISGFIGMAKMAKISETADMTIENCIAWNKNITTSTTNANTWSSGVVVGVSAANNTLTNNYRRADLVYSEKCGEEVFKAYDQENASSSAPLEYHSNKWNGNKCPYHGKAAAAGKTCSQVAKTLGWDENVWDLSGDMPKLK